MKNNSYNMGSDPAIEEYLISGMQYSKDYSFSIGDSIRKSIERATQAAIAAGATPDSVILPSAITITQKGQTSTTTPILIKTPTNGQTNPITPPIVEEDKSVRPSKKAKKLLFGIPRLYAYLGITLVSAVLVYKIIKK